MSKPKLFINKQLTAVIGQSQTVAYTRIVDKTNEEHRFSVS